MAKLHVVSALRNKRATSAGMFVLDIELTIECQHALAFDFVAEGSDGQQIGAQRQLVPGKQGARGDREIASTRLAAPALLARRSRAGVTGHAAADGTNRLAVGGRPAQAQEYILDPAVRHTHDLGGAERTC